VSLINKMLRDLESRQGTAATESASSKPVYQDLHPAETIGRRSSRAAIWVVLAFIAVAGAGYSVWDRMGGHSAAVPSAAKSSFTPAPLARANVAPPAPVATVTPPPAATPAVAPTPPPASPALVALPVASAPPIVAKSAPPEGFAPSAAESRVAPPVPAVEAPTAPAPKKTAKPKRAITPPAAADAADSDGAVDKRMRPFTPQEKAESLYRQAAVYIEQGRSEDAAKQLSAALAAEPGHVKARELLVGISLKNGRWREAQQLLEDGMAKSPMYYPFVHLLARVYVDRGAEDKALALLEAAAPRAAQDPDHRILLATLYQRAGRHAEAVAAYGQVVEQRPQDARSWLGLAISLDAEKKPEAAARAYQRARQLGGLSPQLAAYAEQRIHALNK